MNLFLYIGGIVVSAFAIGFLKEIYIIITRGMRHDKPVVYYCEEGRHFLRRDDLMNHRSVGEWHVYNICLDHQKMMIPLKIDELSNMFFAALKKYIREEDSDK